MTDNRKYEFIIAEKEALEKIFDSLLPVGPKKPGIINDKNITNVDMVENYDKYKLEDIQVPVLVIHSQNDPMASFEDAKKMAERIPRAKFINFEKGGHLIFGYQKEIQNIINNFIFD